jgi:putative Flp pilus-assembly TadE/G-like protein
MRRRPESGQTLVSLAFGMVVVSAVLGLAIDVGYLRFLKRQLQTAVDGAAIAGAAEVNYGDVTAAAKSDAAANGFTDGSSGVTVTVNTPPASGPNQGVAGYVEVLIAKTQPTFFVRIAPGGAASSTVQARAVAYLGNAKGCVYALEPSPGGIMIGTPGRRGGGVDLTTNCALIDNGDFVLHGRADNISASAIGVAGTEYSGSRSTVNPAPQTGMVSGSDPLAYLPTQNPGGCDYTNISVTGGNQTLSEGVYCGGIMITNDANVTFNPGLYVMTPSASANNGLVINSTGTVTGNGVTIYNGANSAPVSIISPGTVSLTAPTTGNYAGVLIFQDPNNGSPATVEGGNDPVFQGALYFPNLNSVLTLDDIGSAADYTIVVAGSLDIRGNNNVFGSNYSSLSSGSPIKDPILVE